ncbi:MAG: hypothetical protein WAM82_19320 [Thermoanaerobaculia bacterium]
MRYQEEPSARRRPHFIFLLLAAALVMSSAGALADTIRAVATPLDALASSAAIVEGTVKENAYTFDEKAGPRTVTTLSDVTADFGRVDDSTLSLATLGGPINDKQGLFIPELPILTDDTRYLVFLTNATWFFSPVVENYVFRLETDANGNEVLITPSGYLVVGLASDGLYLSNDPVVQAQVDLGKPTAKLPLLDGAVLTGAMPKTTFLAVVSRLLSTTPLQGAFAPAPDASRIWNQLTTAQPPLR